MYKNSEYSIMNFHVPFTQLQNLLLFVTDLSSVTCLLVGPLLERQSFFFLKKKKQLKTKIVYCCVNNCEEERLLVLQNLLYSQFGARDFILGSLRN